MDELFKSAVSASVVSNVELSVVINEQGNTYGSVDTKLVKT